MSLAVVQIPPEHIRAVWGLVCDAIESIVGWCDGRYTVETLKRSLEASEKQIWIVWDQTARAVKATALTEVWLMDSGVKEIAIIACTGDGREEWQDMMIDAVKDFGRACDCRAITAVARLGWARALRHRMKMHHVFLEEAI